MRTAHSCIISPTFPPGGCAHSGSAVTASRSSFRDQSSSTPNEAPTPLCFPSWPLAPHKTSASSSWLLTGGISDPRAPPTTLARRPTSRTRKTVRVHRDLSEAEDSTPEDFSSILMASRYNIALDLVTSVSERRDFGSFVSPAEPMSI